MEFEGDKNGHIYNQFLDIMKNFKAHEYVACCFPLRWPVSVVVPSAFTTLGFGVVLCARVRTWAYWPVCTCVFRRA
jgi:hypothetical protein